MRGNAIETAIHEKLRTHIQSFFRTQEVFLSRVELPSRNSGIVYRTPCNCSYCNAVEIQMMDVGKEIPEVIIRHTSILEFALPDLAFHREEIRYRVQTCPACGALNVVYDIEAYIKQLIDNI